LLLAAVLENNLAPQQSIGYGTSKNNWLAKNGLLSFAARH